MALKDMIVHVDDRPQSDDRLRTAMGLAETHGAHLTAVYAIPRAYIPPYAEVHISQEILDAQAKAAAESADRVRAKFEELTAGKGLNVEWRAQEGDVAQVLGFHSRYADLTIVGQPDPADSLFAGDRDMPDRLVLTAGRPVLVIPFTGAGLTVGKRVMVAWDAGVLASRAVHDAMPMLEAAEKVTVMIVNPGIDHEGDRRDPGADISAHLARHGISVEADHVTSDEIDIGNMLLSRAADMSVDLMVMGAYGHARWSEMLLGGVTNRVLTNMTVPVLMSH